MRSVKLTCVAVIAVTACANGRNASTNIEAAPCLAVVVDMTESAKQDRDALPMKIAGGSGGPLRIVARIPRAACEGP